MIGCIVRSADFVRALGTPPRARSAHFTVHHLQGTPERPLPAAVRRRRAELSTGPAPGLEALVDDSGLPAAATVSSSTCALWFGAVVPKRHARRAVTRTLLKRQMRSAVADQQHRGLSAGLWVVRLRAPFDRVKYPSAASAALCAAAREELVEVLAAAARRVAVVVAPAAAA